MLSRILAIPFIIGTGIALGLAFVVDDGYSVYVIPQVIILAAIYMLSPQIDWWWYKKHPPKLEGSIEQLLRQRFKYYRDLSEEYKVHFRNRVGMYIQAKDFIAKGWDSVPEDIKVFIAANAIQLTFGMEDYRMSDFERIVVYPIPFPSPQYPRDFHASEVYPEDGVVLFSAEQLLAGSIQARNSFNIGLYENAKIFTHCNPELNYPAVDEQIWPALEEISGLSRQFMTDYIGLPSIDILPVIITLFLSYPQNFHSVLPSVFGQLKELLNQDPMNGLHPPMKPIDYSKF